MQTERLQKDASHGAHRRDYGHRRARRRGHPGRHPRVLLLLRDVPHREETQGGARGAARARCAHRRTACAHPAAAAGRRRRDGPGRRGAGGSAAGLRRGRPRLPQAPRDGLGPDRAAAPHLRGRRRLRRPPLRRPAPENGRRVVCCTAEGDRSRSILKSDNSVSVRRRAVSFVKSGRARRYHFPLPHLTTLLLVVAVPSTVLSSFLLVSSAPPCSE
mmetsp:Transcript_11932/g.48092  ORF Transcript_11932/g.48092 Transcript_11932/m.48092 type:complete len:216 (-) Transcript_11932:62-709(-)